MSADNVYTSTVKLFSSQSYRGKKIKPPKTTVKILYVILSCKYFLRIPTKTTFITAGSWKSYQPIIEDMSSFFLHLTLVTSCAHLLPSIMYILDNLFGSDQ